jgi:hypothetical protein
MEVSAVTLAGDDGNTYMYVAYYISRFFLEDQQVQCSSTGENNCIISKATRTRCNKCRYQRLDSYREESNFHQ